MVNKKTKEAGRNLPASIFSSLCICFLTFAFFLVSSFNARSQDVSKHFVAYQQEIGMLYFIYPQKGFESKHNKEEFVYDITYLNSGDSVVFNFTYIDSRILQPDSLSFFSSESATPIVAPVSKIYIESSKSNWIYRYGAKFLFSEFSSHFPGSTSPVFKLYCGDEVIIIDIKDGKWKKQSGILSKIFDIIKLNQPE